MEFLAAIFRPTTLLLAEAEAESCELTAAADVLV